MSEPVVTQSPVPLPRRLEQGCASCGIECTFHVVDSPRDDVPSFLTPVWPDTCWVGWAWSEVPGKLVLLCYCSQTCLVHWMEDKQATPPAEAAAPREDLS